MTVTANKTDKRKVGGVVVMMALRRREEGGWRKDEAQNLLFSQWSWPRTTPNYAVHRFSEDCFSSHRFRAPIGIWTIGLFARNPASYQLSYMVPTGRYKRRRISLSSSILPWQVSFDDKAREIKRQSSFFWPHSFFWGVFTFCFLSLDLDDLPSSFIAFHSHHPKRFSLSIFWHSF